MITATETHLATIRARRIDATARAMIAEGFTMTYEQADELGDEATDWIEQRLGLSVVETDLRVECSPAAPVCDHCGYRVPADGVTLSEDEDVDTTGQDRPRCSDSACTC